MINSYLLASITPLEAYIPMLAVFWCSTAQSSSACPPISALTIHQDVADIPLVDKFVTTHRGSDHRFYHTIPQRRFIGLTRRLILCTHLLTFSTQVPISCSHTINSHSAYVIRNRQPDFLYRSFRVVGQWSELVALHISTETLKDDFATLNKIFVDVNFPRLMALWLPEHELPWPEAVNSTVSDTPSLPLVKWYNGPARFLGLMPSLQVSLNESGIPLTSDRLTHYTTQTALISVANWADQNALIRLPASLTTLQICYYSVFTEYGGCLDDIAEALHGLYPHMNQLKHLSFTQGPTVDGTINAVRLLPLLVKSALFILCFIVPCCGHTICIILIFPSIGTCGIYPRQRCQQRPVTGRFIC